MMRRKILVSLFFYATALQAQNGTMYTLQQCIDLAWANNALVNSATYDQENAKAFLQQSRAQVLPNISAYANQGISNGKSINPYTNTFINQKVNTGQYGLNASLPLFNGFSNLTTWQQYSLTHKASQMDLAQTKIDIAIQVTVAYFQVLSNTELLKQAHTQMEATKAQMQRLVVLEKNGALSPATLYDTKAQLCNDKLAVVNAEAAAVSARLSLAQLLNTNVPTDSKFEGIPFELGDTTANTDEYFAKVQANNPMLKSVALKRMAAQKYILSSKGQLFPSLSLNGSLGSNYSSAALTQTLSNVYNATSDAYVDIAGTITPVMTPVYEYTSNQIAFTNQVKNNLNSYVGLSLQVPLFNGLRNKTQISRAKIAYNRSVVDEKTTQIKFKTAIEQVLNDKNAVYKRYKILKEQIGYYEASYAIAKAKFEQGAIATYEYIIAKTNYEKAMANFISAQYDYMTRQKILSLYQQ